MTLLFHVYDGFIWKWEKEDMPLPFLFQGIEKFKKAAQEVQGNIFSWQASSSLIYLFAPIYSCGLLL